MSFDQKKGEKAGEKSKWQDVMSSYNNLRNTETKDRNKKWKNSERLLSHCSITCVTRGMLSHKNLKQKRKRK